MPNVKPTKPELAKIKALNDLGVSPNKLGKIAKRDPKTIRKYLAMDKVWADPELRKMIEVIKKSEINEMVEAIKKSEISELYLIGARTRQRIRELLEKDNLTLIPAVATLDRVFSQRRILEEKSTSNVSVVSVVEHLSKEIERSDAKLEELEAEMAELDAELTELDDGIEED